MLKPISVLLITAGLLFAGCRSRSANSTQYFTIADATKEQFFTLTRLGTHESPKSVQLRVTGKIESAAKLIVLLNGHPQQTLELTAGAVETEWHGEWLSSQLSLHYLPAAVKSGALQIACQFSD